MFRSSHACCALLLGSLAVGAARAAGPPVFFNPLKGFVRSPFSAEMEVYSGAITGKSVGAAFDSATKGDYGVRFTFGFLKALNFSLNYLYSNQTRSFTAVTPQVPSLGLPSGSALMHAANLNMFFGNGELNLFRVPKATFYLSPGVGFVRNGARSMTLITPLGTASSPILPGTAVTFNLGAGVKIFPVKHFGVRFDVRDYVSGGGTGNLNSSLKGPAINLCAITNPNCTTVNVGQYFGKIPVQNNLTFTLGLIFKIL